MIGETLDFLAGKTRPHGRGKSVGAPHFDDRNIHAMVKPTEDVIRRYPAAALATAFIVGVAIAWWIKRK